MVTNPCSFSKLSHFSCTENNCGYHRPQRSKHLSLKCMFYFCCVVLYFIVLVEHFFRQMMMRIHQKPFKKIPHQKIKLAKAYKHKELLNISGIICRNFKKAFQQLETFSCIGFLEKNLYSVIFPGFTMKCKLLMEFKIFLSHKV